MQKVETPQNNFAARAALQAKYREQVEKSGLLIRTVRESLAKVPTPLAAEDQEKLASLGKIPDQEEFFHGLLHFGIQLKQDRKLDHASIVLGLLTQNEEISPAVKAKAVRELDAIAGKGSTGMRLEVLTGQLAQDATNFRVIAPMLGASIIGRLVATTALSRLAVSPGAGWMTRGFGARFAAGTTGYLAEFPSFALLNRAAAPHVESGLGEDLQRAAITIGALKIFGYAGNQGFLKLHGFNEFGVPTRLGRMAKFHQSALPQISMFTGLLAAHHLEVELGLRPQVDGATTVTDTLASLFSLGVGSHLGHRALGPRFAAFQQELALKTRDPSPAPPGAPSPSRGEGNRWVSATEILQASQINMPSPLEGEGGRRPGEGSVWMAMAGDSSGGGRKGPTYTRESYVEHGLTTYRDLAQDSFMGDPLKNIRERLKKNPGAVRILDVGSGNGIAVRELKERFKDQVQVETNDLDPISLYYIDGHYQGDFLQTAFEKPYDLIFSIYGAHAYHEGKLVEMLQKTAELLKPGGEFYASLTSESIHQPNFFQPLDGFKKLAKILQAMDQGLLIRYEEVAGGAAIYMKRLKAAPLPSLSAILESSTPKLSERARRELQGQIVAKLVASRVKTMGATLDLGYPYAEFTAELFSQLEVREFSSHPVKWVRRLFENYLRDFQQRHARLPNAHEIGRWVSGNEPSALAREPLLIDELLRLKLEALEKKAPQAPEPAAAKPGPLENPPLERDKAHLINRFHEKALELPYSHPARTSLDKAVKELYLQAAFKPDEVFLLSEISRLEASLDSTWLEIYQRASTTFGASIEASGLKLTVTTPEPQEAKQRVTELAGLFFATVKGLAVEKWEELSPAPFPFYLKDSLEGLCQTLLHLDLIGTRLDPAALRDLVREATQFYHDYPPPMDEPHLQLIPESKHPTAHNFLLGSRPDANKFLSSIADNLRGYRRLFKADAGKIFHRQLRLNGELRGLDGNPSEYLLLAEKGHLEFETGLMLRLVKRNEFHFNPDTYLAKLGINFSADGGLRIVNIQGAAPNPFRDANAIPGLKALLGDSDPLDMLVATAILLGRNAGFKRMEGIRDQAQIARAEHSRDKGRGTGFYDLFFRKFGFRPPEGGNDYWFLDLAEMEIHRSKPLLSREALEGEAERRSGDVEQGADPKMLESLSEEERALLRSGAVTDHREKILKERKGSYLPALGVLHPGDYFRQVLIRRTRDEAGRRIRPEFWDRQVPAASASSVKAFWKVMAPALSQLEWSPVGGYSLNSIKPDLARPFHLVNLQPQIFPEAPKFYESSATQWAPGKSPLEPRYREEFFATLNRAQRGRISPERAEPRLIQILQDDWVAKLEREGAEVSRFSLAKYFKRMEASGAKLPEWVLQAVRYPQLKREPVLQIEMNPQVYGAILEREHRGIAFAFEVFRLLAEEMGLPKDAFAQDHSDTSRTVLLPGPSFFLRAARLIQGDRAIGRQASPDIVTPERLRELMGADERPAVLSIYPQNIHDSPKTHPFIAFKHDDYHIYKLNKLSPETRLDLNRLHDAFLATEATGDVERSLKQTVLEQVLDGNPEPEGEAAYRPLWIMVRDAAPSKPFVAELRRNLEIQFQANPRLKLVLQDFDAVLNKTNKPGGALGGLGNTGALALMLGVGTSLALLTSSEPAFAAAREGDIQSKGWELPLNGALMMSWLGGLTFRQILRELARSWWDSFLKAIRVRKSAPALPAAPKPDSEAPPQNTGTESGSFSKLRLLPAGLAEEWIKNQKKKLTELLPQPKVDLEEKKWAVQVFLKELGRIRLDSARVVEAMQLLWEIGFSPHLDEESREWALYDYVGYLRNAGYFPENSAQVYREALRLRRIFSKPGEDMEKRLRAVAGYLQLIGKFDPQGHIAQGEAAMGIKALQILQEEQSVKADMRARVKVKGALGMLSSRFPRLPQ